MREGQIVHLNPDELEIHPSLELLEENDIFPITEESIQKLTVSISEMDIL